MTFPIESSHSQPPSPVDTAAPLYSTERDRFVRTLHYQAVDRPPFYMAGPWASTMSRWHAEGLPEGADFLEYLCVPQCHPKHVGIETQIFPSFEPEVIEDHGKYVLRRNERGALIREPKDQTSMPEFLEYPLTGPECMDGLRTRLAPDNPGRVRPDWPDLARRLQRSGQPVFCNGGSYFGFLNEHMGTDRLMLAYFDTPELLHEVNDLLCRNCEQALTLASAQIALDYVGYHEDMAYKNGSIISPAMVREFMMPFYRRVQAIRRAAGLDLGVMDCDGDIHELIPLWLEVGINVMLPIEVAAGMDVADLRAEYGQDLGLIGGFDKRILADSPQAIRNEMNRLQPVIEGGGYLCGCDHGIPPDVPWKNFRCFIDCLKTILGLN
jgi:uroporphyrinogen decarboxylase